MTETQIIPNAENGKSRVVNGKKISTAEIVNQAITIVNETGLNLSEAEETLKATGWTAPTQAMIDMGFADETGEETIKNFAIQTAILNEIEALSGSSASNQVGKWDFTNAQTILEGFEAYLWKRVHGHRQSFSK